MSHKYLDDSAKSNDWIRPPLVFFFCIFEKNLKTTGPSHFLSPNGQYDGQDSKDLPVVKQLMLKMRKYWLEKAQEVICSKFFKILYTF